MSNSKRKNRPTQGKGWKVVNENGRPILHYEGIEHPIVKVKERYVNGERVVDYVVEDGTKFEHRTRQGDMVPPWVTHWWQLRGTTTVYLRGCTLRELARKAVERAGSQRKLAKCVLKLDQSGISRILSGQYKGICIGSLRRLLDFLETGYSSFQRDRSHRTSQIDKESWASV